MRGSKTDLPRCGLPVVAAVQQKVSNPRPSQIDFDSSHDEMLSSMVHLTCRIVAAVSCWGHGCRIHLHDLGLVAWHAKPP